MDLLKAARILFAGLSLLCACSLVLTETHRYEQKYITLPVDQFTFTIDKTFQLRYLINDTYTGGNPDAPILFYCGNEADIEFFAKNTGFMWEFAQEINALIVFAEHRYYGKSLPFGNESMTNAEHYGYLTVEQTLADFAALVEHLNKDASSNRPTIAIGGSYGGILSALFRIKYPHLVAGALASSAPLRQFSNLTPCEEYSKTITRAFNTAYNEHCTSNIKRSWTAFRDLAFEPGGVDYFNEVFNFCEPWTDSYSINGFIDSLTDIYWDMSMTNYPYEADVYTPLPAYPIKEFCSHLGTEYYGRKLLVAFKGALDVYTNPKGDKKCFEFPKRRVMQPYENEAWGFQRCTELTTGICDRSEDNMFPPGGENFNEAVDSCRETYGDRVDLAVNRIKNHFGVDNLRTATKIVFSNGMLDPWSAASILKVPNEETFVINIPKGAHHIDLRHSNKMDPPSVTEARVLEKIYLKKWIREFRRRRYSFM